MNPSHEFAFVRRDRNRDRRTPTMALLTMLALALTSAGLAASSFREPLAASSATSVTVSCPTLRWNAVEGAAGYELALITLSAEEEAPSISSAEAVLVVTMAGARTAWRPTSAWCPRDGERYAWAVRPLGARPIRPGTEAEPVNHPELQPVGEWSEPRSIVGGSPGRDRGLHRLVAELEASLESPEARLELREILDQDAVARIPEPDTGLPAGHPATTLDGPRSVAAAASGGGPVSLGPHFLGTTAAQDFELRLDGERVLLVQPTAGTTNLISGSFANSVVTGVVGATIAGGGGSGLDANLVRDDYGTIGGGRGNAAGDAHVDTSNAVFATVGGGTSNAATDPSATVGGGTQNVASGNFTTVAGGLQNFADGAHASIGGGQWNDVLHQRATIPGGLSAKARLFGQLAYAAGGFGGQLQPGDAQWSLYVLLAETSDATPTKLFLASGAFDLSLETGQTLAFRAYVSAMDATGGESAGYRVEGLIENVGGTTSFVGGAPVVTVLGEDRSNWDLIVTANDTSDSLDFIATGAESAEIRWVATVRATEVRF